MEGLAEIECNILDDIDLSFSELLDDDVHFLAMALRKNTKVTKLDLRFNQITPVGCQHLAEALKINETLLHLHLWTNQIGAEGCERLCDALLVNKTLLSLDLGDNNIGNAGFLKIIRMLEVNRTLKNLYLWNNGISSTGVRSFVEFLKLQEKEVGQVFLEVMDLQYNNIGGSGDKLLASVVEKTGDAVIRSAFQVPGERRSTIRLSWSSTGMDGNKKDYSADGTGTSATKEKGWEDIKEGIKYHGDHFVAHRLLNNVTFSTERQGAIYPQTGVYDSFPSITFEIADSYAPERMYEATYRHPLHPKKNPLEMDGITRDLLEETYVSKKPDPNKKIVSLLAARKRKQEITREEHERKGF